MSRNAENVRAERAPGAVVSGRIGAPAEQIFALLADPTVHPDIDGSGMVRRAVSSSPVSGVGDVFYMAMHNDEMGDYEMGNEIVEFEPGRAIAWEPFMSKAGRPEDEEGIGDRAHHVWAFQLTALGPDETEVSESYDCSRSPEWLRKAVRGGERWAESMRITLDRLAVMATEPAGRA